MSEKAVENLVTGAIDVEILNRLLGHGKFPQLVDLIRIYFEDTAAMGIMARNEVINMAVSSIKDMARENPEHRNEAGKDIRFLNAQKIGSHEAEMEKIKNVFLSILRDVKAEMEKGIQPETMASVETIRNLQTALVDRLPERSVDRNTQGGTLYPRGHAVPKGARCTQGGTLYPRGHAVPKGACYPHQVCRVSKSVFRVLSSSGETCFLFFIRLVSQFLRKITPYT